MNTCIPLKAAVKKYILGHWGPEPVKFDRKHITGQLMLNLDIELGHPVPDEEMKGDLLLVQFPTRHVAIHYAHHQHQVHAGNYMFSIFSHSMLTWTDAQTQAGVSAWKAIEDFLASYEILEEDYSLESAYRYWQKYKPVRIDTKKALSA